MTALFSDVVILLLWGFITVAVAGVVGHLWLKMTNDEGMRGPITMVVIGLCIAAAIFGGFLRHVYVGMTEPKPVIQAGSSQSPNAHNVNEPQSRAAEGRENGTREDREKEDG